MAKADNVKPQEVRDDLKKTDVKERIRFGIWLVFFVGFVVSISATIVYILNNTYSVLLNIISLGFAISMVIMSRIGGKI